MPEPAHNRVTIDSVAERAGVSTATVSRVINKTGPVADATARRVYAAVAELNYIPHMGARALASRRTDTIGLVFPALSDVFFFELIRGIQETAAGHGYALLLYTTDLPERVDVLNLPLGEHNTDGLIVFTNSLADDALRRLHTHGLPLVLLHRSPPAGLPIPCVTFENKDGAYAVVRHLLETGRRRIAFLAGAADNEDSTWRELGYRQALADYGLAPNPVIRGEALFEERLAEALVSRWLAEGLQPDAIFAADDVSARGALRAVQAAGLIVPDDIAVVGFDDALLSRYLDPPLTTVRAPIEEAGRAAARQLLRLLHGEAAEPLTLLPTQLVIRGSCCREHRIDPKEVMPGDEVESVP